MSTYQKAKVNYRCDRCNELIRTGETYSRNSGKATPEVVSGFSFEGKDKVVRTHLACPEEGKP